MTEADWVPAFALDEVAVGGAKLLRAGGKQIAVFRLDRERLYAVDNRCPHEGYPLVQGYVKDCLLTCAWHNYKFDLRDGRCVMGDEDVRTFPVRVTGAGLVEVDVRDPAPAEELPRVWRSFEDGMTEARLGQVARDIVRLLELGTTPEEVALRIARFDAERGEYGPSHALPLARDVLEYTARYPGPHAVLPLMQAAEMAAEACVRRTPRRIPEPVDPGRDMRAAGRRLRALVEAEECAAAEALLRGALKAGYPQHEIEQWMLGLCADHFLDFGHALIYVVKTFDLLAAVGWQHAADILPALLYGIAVGTREDTLPPWNAFRARLGEIEPGFGDVLTHLRDEAPGEWDRDAMLSLVLDGRDGDAFAAVQGSLEAGVPLGVIVNTLSLAAAERLGRFDVTHDRDVGVQDGWLFVTHLLTYANAVRHAVARHDFGRDDGPRALRHVFYLARFINKAKPLDLPPEGRGVLAKVRLRETRTDALAQIAEHIREKRTPEAVSLVLKYLGRKREVDALRDALLDLALEDGLCTRPILAAHVIKTTVAAFDEHDHLPREDKMRTHPLLALVRFLSSPIVERRTAQRCHEAVNFVVHGKVPRVLS